MRVIDYRQNIKINTYLSIKKKIILKTLLTISLTLKKILPIRFGE